MKRTVSNDVRQCVVDPHLQGFLMLPGALSLPFVEAAY